MTRVLLIYPYLRPPARPLALSLSAARAGLRGRRPARAGHEVELLDCTFLDRDEGPAAARASGAPVVGVYAMATLAREALWFAERLRGRCELLVAGGPLPTCEPESFRRAFDAVVRGEGEQTMVEIVAAYAAGADPGAVPGVVRGAGGGEAAAAEAPPRPFAADLDELAFPARDLLPNEAYIAYGRQKYGYAITTVMSTRGCPFACEFCSNVVFGDSYRERSPGNVVDEVEEALALGYDRISFADDVFTLDRRRVLAVCDEIARRGLRFTWECLGRVDTLDGETAARMRQAGCFTRLLRHRVGQRRRARAHGQADHDRARRAPPSRRPTSAGLRGGRLLHRLLSRRERRHRARHAALRRLAAARLPGPDDALPAARHGAHRSGSPAARGASGASAAAC